MTRDVAYVIKHWLVCFIARRGRYDSAVHNVTGVASLGRAKNQWFRNRTDYISRTRARWFNERGNRLFVEVRSDFCSQWRLNKYLLTSKTLISLLKYFLYIVLYFVSSHYVKKRRCSCYNAVDVDANGVTKPPTLSTDVIRNPWTPYPFSLLPLR